VSGFDRAGRRARGVGRRQVVRQEQVMHRVSGLVTATIVVWALSGVLTSARQERELTLKLEGLPPGASVTVQLDVNGAPAGSAKGAAGPDGDVMLALSIGSLPKPQETLVDVFVGDCANQEVRVMIVAQGIEPPPECSRRRIGGFYLNRQLNITIRYPNALAVTNGLFSTRNLTIMGAGATAVIIGVTAGGDDGDGGVSFPSYNGTYTGSGTATVNSCNFGSPAAMSGVLTLNDAGTGTWVKTHTQAGVTFTFPITATRAAAGLDFMGSINQLIGANTYTITDTASVSSQTLTLTQTFSRAGAAPCTVTYLATLTAP
jgi:hypothetical protein